ncbi:MAG: response regulator [Planctomycetota bacterium]
MSRILLIDADPAETSALAQRLVAAGHTVSIEHDGWLGLERVLAEVFDIVVTEMLLPRRDGAELIGELRGLQPRLPVIARTGGDDEFDVQDLLDLAQYHGAAGGLSKGLDLDVVVTYLGRWIERARLENEEGAR